MLCIACGAAVATLSCGLRCAPALDPGRRLATAGSLAAHIGGGDIGRVGDDLARASASPPSTSRGRMRARSSPGHVGTGPPRSATVRCEPNTGRAGANGLGALTLEYGPLGLPAMWNRLAATVPAGSGSPSTRARLDSSPDTPLRRLRTVAISNEDLDHLGRCVELARCGVRGGRRAVRFAAARWRRRDPVRGPQPVSRTATPRGTPSSPSHAGPRRI